MLAANQPLVVPMLLRLSNFKLNAYVVLVVSKPKGITLVFKTDPLQNVDISSTFDSIAVIQKFIQQEIEGQLRQMFREDLPGIIHRLSQRWVRSTTMMGDGMNAPNTTVEAPYLRQRPSFPNAPNQSRLETMSNPDLSRFPSGSAWQPSLLRPPGRPGLNPRAVTMSARSVASKSSYGDLRATANTTSRSEIGYSNHFGGDTDSAEELSERPSFSALGRLHRPSRGLADLMEDPVKESLYPDDDAVSDASVEVDESTTYDVVEWEDTVPDMSSTPEDGETPPSTARVTEYETIPAVGGGYISRPRVYHSTSLHHASSSNSSISSSTTPPRPGVSLRRITPTRVQSYDSYDVYASRTQYANSAITSRQHPLQEYPFPPSPQSDPPRRRASFSRTQPPSSPFLAPLPDSSFDPSGGDLETASAAQIVLRPGLNNTVTQLSLLNHANHTLSPYARTLEHFAVRSAPPKERGGVGGPGSGNGNTILGAGTAVGFSAGQERQPARARRKRTYRLGGKKPPVHESESSAVSKLHDRPYSPHPPPSTPPMASNHLPPPPLSPSDFDESDIDRYFRPYDGQSQLSLQGAVGASSPAPISASQSFFRRRTSHRSLKG